MIPFWNPWDHRSYLGIVCTIFGHPQNDQEGQKYLLKRVLEDFGCIDADYDIIALYMIYFQNYWDNGSTYEYFAGFFVIIRVIRKVKYVLKTVF